MAGPGARRSRPEDRKGLHAIDSDCQQLPGRLAAVAAAPGPLLIGLAVWYAHARSADVPEASRRRPRWHRPDRGERVRGRPLDGSTDAEHPPEPAGLAAPCRVDRRRAGRGGADRRRHRRGRASCRAAQLDLSARAVTTACTRAARPGHLGGRRAAGPADHDARRPERAEVLARLIARPDRRDRVLRLLLHTGVPVGGPRARRGRARAARAQRPVLVVVSVNPRDTPASTRAAVRKWGLAGVAGWHWLRGSHAQLAASGRAYHIFVAPPANGDIAHTEALYLIDRRGDERSAYLYPFAPGVRRPPTCDAVAAREVRRMASPDSATALPARRRRAAPGRARGALARLRDADQAADHVAARADRRLRDGRGAPTARPRRSRWPRSSLGGALACGGASALNHVLDRDIDRLMGPRTASRPVAAGRIAPARAVAFGLSLLVLSFVVLTAFANVLRPRSCRCPAAPSMCSSTRSG